MPAEDGSAKTPCQMAGPAGAHLTASGTRTRLCSNTCWVSAGKQKHTHTHTHVLIFFFFFFVGWDLLSKSHSVFTQQNIFRKTSKWFIWFSSRNCCIHAFWRVSHFSSLYLGRVCRSAQKLSSIPALCDLITCFLWVHPSLSVCSIRDDDFAHPLSVSVT